MRNKLTHIMHRWSRPVMAGIASIGASVTAYLTYTKLTGNQAACPNIECTKPDKRTQMDICREQKIQGYPHWQIGDKSFTGVQPLIKLAELSGYKGIRDFKNTVAKDEH